MSSLKWKTQVSNTLRNMEVDDFEDISKIEFPVTSSPLSIKAALWLYNPLVEHGLHSLAVTGVNHDSFICYAPVEMTPYFVANKAFAAAFASSSFNSDISEPLYGLFKFIDYIYDEEAGIRYARIAFHQLSSSSMDEFVKFISNLQNQAQHDKKFASLILGEQS